MQQAPGDLPSHHLTGCIKCLDVFGWQTQKFFGFVTSLKSLVSTKEEASASASTTFEVQTRNSKILVVWGKQSRDSEFLRKRQGSFDTETTVAMIYPSNVTQISTLIEI